MALRFSSEAVKGILTWLITAAIITHQAYQSKDYDTKTNLARATGLCLLFISVALYNTSRNNPYSTLGRVQLMARGVSVVLVCVLIFIVTANYDDAREITSIFERLPTQAEIDK